MLNVAVGLTVCTNTVAVGLTVCTNTTIFMLNVAVGLTVCTNNTIFMLNVAVGLTVSTNTTISIHDCSRVDQWFPKWAVPTPGGRWDYRGGR
jgi:hypothetical protein